MPHNLTNDELIRTVLSATQPTELERVLAERLSEAEDELQDWKDRESCPTCGD